MEHKKFILSAIGIIVILILLVVYNSHISELYDNYDEINKNVTNLGIQQAVSNAQLNDILSELELLRNENVKLNATVSTLKSTMRTNNNMSCSTPK